MDARAKFRAVMRCPVCMSDNTKVQATPSDILRDSIPVDVYIKWLCNTCHKEFRPSNTKEFRPVLMCEGCREPRVHALIGPRERIWREAPGVSRPLRNILVDMWVCSCGLQREYGIT